MTCHLIPIGGTGVRVMKSLMYMCMAGCFKNIDFNVMCIDSDNTNGDMNELESLFKMYNDMNSDVLAKVKLVNVKGSATGVWSPLTDENGRSKDKESSMSDMVMESHMSKEAKKILEFLYTKAEREKILEGGFYGHTSIGAYFMAQEVVKDGEYTDVWKGYFDEIGKEDKIFIIGSIFGGTGASGVPTIARIIKENSVTKDHPIGAIFVMPYFKPQRKEDELSELPIDWTSFSTKTKTALSFYQEQQFEKIFDTMYFIGEDPDNFMSVEYHEFGTKQANKANPIEVFAATAVLDFMQSELNEQMRTKFLVKTETEEDGIVKHYITKEMLNEICGHNIFQKMGIFLKFSMLYVKYLFPCIRQGYSTEGWMSHYKKIDKEKAEILRKICVQYLSWIKKLTLNNSIDGRLDVKSENANLKWFKYKGYENLYDDKELEGTVTGLLIKHERYDYEKIEGIESIIRDEKKSTAKDIIESLANKIDEMSKKNHEKSATVLGRLMLDFMELLKEEV